MLDHDTMQVLIFETKALGLDFSSWTSHYVPHTHKETRKGFLVISHRWDLFFMPKMFTQCTVENKKHVVS